MNQQPLNDLELIVELAMVKSLVEKLLALIQASTDENLKRAVLGMIQQMAASRGRIAQDALRPVKSE